LTSSLQLYPNQSLFAKHSNGRAAEKQTQENERKIKIENNNKNKKTKQNK
jgi:hypothetical protein